MLSNHERERESERVSGGGEESERKKMEEGMKDSKERKKDEERKRIQKGTSTKMFSDRRVESRLSTVYKQPASKFIQVGFIGKTTLASCYY